MREQQKVFLRMTKESVKRILVSLLLIALLFPANVFATNVTEILDENVSIDNKSMDSLDIMIAAYRFMAGTGTEPSIT